MFQKGDIVKIKHLYCGGADGEGRVVGPAKEWFNVGKLLVETEGLVIPIEVERLQLLDNRPIK